MYQQARPSRLYGGRDEAFESFVRDFIRNFSRKLAATRAIEAKGAASPTVPSTIARHDVGHGPERMPHGFTARAPRITVLGTISVTRREVRTG